MIQHKEVYKDTPDIQGNKPHTFTYTWAEYLPIVTSEELWASKNLFRCCQTLGIQSIILTSSAFLILPLISVSMSFLLRKRPRKPLTGSVWFAHSTHLWQDSRKGHHFCSMLMTLTIPDYISLLIYRLSGSKRAIPAIHVFQQKLLRNISRDEPIFIVHCFSSFLINLLCLNTVLLKIW